MAKLQLSGQVANDVNGLIQDSVDAMDGRFGVGEGAEAHVHGTQAHGEAPHHRVPWCKQPWHVRGRTFPNKGLRYDS